MIKETDKIRKSDHNKDSEGFCLDPLVGNHLLKELPAFKNYSFRYSDLNSFLPELKGKTIG